MSTKKPILSAVLTVLGLLGLASADPADPQPPESPSGTAPASAIAPGPSGEPDPAPTPPPQGVILLTDGQVVQGTIVLDEGGCLLKTPAGSKRFPHSRIEKTFASIQEVYEYKLNQFPEEDTQERLKLAQWCIAQKLQEEAKVQLNGVLKLNPKHPQAKAMLEKIEQAEVRKAKHAFDPGVQQAQATSDDMTEGGPKEMDPTAIPRTRTKPMLGGIVDVPEIFNLPRPTALRLTEEFNKSIHQILQVYCAKCHNDRYPGEFQLRQVRSRRELSRDTLNLNLEATLQLIDPANPSKSEILSSALRPHGGYGKTQRPIFRGSNDPSYQKLSHWVNSVCKPLKSDAVRQASAQADLTAEEERFAADRRLNLGDPATRAGAAAATAAAQNRRTPAARPSAPQGMRGMAGSSQAQAGADPNAFPLANLENATSLRTGAPVQIPPALPNGTAAKAPISSEGVPGVPEGAPGLPTDVNAAPPAAAATKPKKKAPPVKLDPALLEGVLKARNSGN